MFAIFGLGIQEIVLLLIVAVLLVGIPLAVVLMVTRMSAQTSSREAALEEQNRRLRAELDRDRAPPP